MIIKYYIDYFLILILVAITGTEIDGTPFSEINPEYAEKILEEHGFNKYGLETMYSGINGEPIECKIFIGPIYYLRLKHLSSDKISARSTGQNTGLTRQPVKGKDFGGAKIGEMERDCIIAHGTAKYLKEKLLDNSDAYDCYVCDREGRQRLLMDLHLYLSKSQFIIQVMHFHQVDIIILIWVMVN